MHHTSRFTLSGHLSPCISAVIRAHPVKNQGTWGLVTLRSLVSSRISHLSSLRPHILQEKETCPDGP